MKQAEATAQTDAEAPIIDLKDPSLYINRELSWIEFNGRVLGEAQDPEKPLAERLKFLAIVGSNLDEFFMVRVAGLKRQVESGALYAAADGLAPAEQLERISAACHQQIRAQYQCLLKEALPALEERGAVIHPISELSSDLYEWVDNYFHRQVFPVLTPLAIDSGHPFPRLRSMTLNLAVSLRKSTGGRMNAYFAVVQTPQSISRFVRLPVEGLRFVLLEDIIMEFIGDLFHGLEIESCHPFYVLRDSDMEIDEEESQDLLEMIEGELRKRATTAVVRLDIGADCPDDVLEHLMRGLNLKEEDVYRVDGMLRLRDLMGLTGQIDLPELFYPPFVPHTISRMKASQDIFETIRDGDILLHHPYESFDTVIEFLNQAANDPNVLAIKQTLYRTDGDSAIVQALETAAENGKQVTALVELKARFDEQANIAWARRLERAGVHVVYGLVGLKTHCKALLVVRQEEGLDRLRRYVHIGTGNYNSSTARLYTDLGLLTCDLQFGRDASRLFNLLTGFSEFPVWRRFIVAPLELQDTTVEMIRREQKHAEEGRQGRIIAKMNSLVDPRTIRALYRASRAGVQIDLIVRGICCLRAGVPGVSENIRVRSIVGRFLEHTRVYYFRNNGAEEVYLSSADWMPRNFLRRVEIMFPIEDPRLKRRIIEETLELHLKDDCQARTQNPDGSYEWTKAPFGQRLDCQARFLDIAAKEHGEQTMRPFSADFLLRHVSERDLVHFVLDE